MAPAKNKTGGTTGSNQYKTKGVAKQPSKPLVIEQLSMFTVPAAEEPEPVAAVEPIERPWTEGFSVRQPVWRSVGAILPEHPESREEAKLYAGHAWEPLDTPAYELVDTVDGGKDYRPIPGYKRIVRSDTGQFLGMSASTRATIGIDVLYDIMEALAHDSGISYEAGGVLEGGREVWLVAKLDHPISVPGDESRLYPYLTVQNRIVGPGACRVGWTTIRLYPGIGL